MYAAMAHRLPKPAAKVWLICATLAVVLLFNLYLSGLVRAAETYETHTYGVNVQSNRKPPKLINANKPWSRGYALHAPAVLRACQKVFECNPGSPYAHCNDDEDHTYSNLVVILPDDISIKAKNESLEVVQSTIFSSIMSGTFSRKSNIIFITSHPRHYNYDHNYPLHSLPVRVFTAEDLCYSLAKKGDDNIVEFVMNKMVSPKSVEYYTQGDDLYDADVYDIELPLTLLWSWYSIMAANPSENYVSTGGQTPMNAISKIQSYYSHNKSSPYIRSPITFHPLEIVSRTSLSDPTVLLIFGDNDAYARLVKVGLLGPEKNRGDGLMSFDLKSLDSKSLGFVQNIKKNRYVTGNVYPDDYINSFISPSMNLFNCTHQQEDPMKYNMKMFGDILGVDNYPGSFSTGRFHGFGKAMVNICSKYGGRVVNGLRKPDDVKSSICRLDDFTCESPTKWWGSKGTGRANVALASLLASFSPRKIIQMELISDEDKSIYKDGYSPDAVNILPFIMGCPDFYTSYISESNNTIRTKVDSYIFDSCFIGIGAKQNTHLIDLQALAFSHVYADTEENNVTPMHRYHPPGCRNSVLSLYVTGNKMSALNYAKVAKHYNTVISDHLNEDCRPRKRQCFAWNTHIGSDYDCLLWTKDYYYYEEVDRVLCAESDLSASKCDQNMKKITNNANGLYSWYLPVECDNTESNSGSCLFEGMQFVLLSPANDTARLVKAVDENNVVLPL